MAGSRRILTAELLSIGTELTVGETRVRQGCEIPRLGAAEASRLTRAAGSQRALHLGLGVGRAPIGIRRRRRDPRRPNQAEEIAQLGEPGRIGPQPADKTGLDGDRKSTRLNSSHV